MDLEDYYRIKDTKIIIIQDAERAAQKAAEAELMERENESLKVLQKREVIRIAADGDGIVLCQPLILFVCFNRIK